MATTKPRLSQAVNSSSPKQPQFEFRGIANDPAKVRHITKQLDAFIEHATANEMSFGSWGEVKETFEEFSDQRGTAKVGMTWRDRENGEVGGLMFFLRKDPEDTVSGKFLVKALNHHFKEQLSEPRDEQYFHPSRLEAVLQVGAVEYEVETIEGELEALIEPLEEDLEGLDIDDAGSIDEIEEEKGDGVSVQSSRLLRKSPRIHPQSTRENQIYEQKRHLNDIENLGHRMAHAGSEVNGQTYIGLGIQAIATAVAMLPSDDPVQRQLDEAEKLLQNLENRYNNAAQRANKLPQLGQEESEEQTAANTQTAEELLQNVDNRYNQAAQRVNKLPQPEQEESEEPKTSGSDDTSGETETPIAARSVEQAGNEDPDVSQTLAVVSNKLGDQITGLENKVSSDSKESKLKPLEPLNLDDRDSIEIRLAQIIEHLHKLSERMDALEAAITKLEEQFAVSQQQTTAEEQVQLEEQLQPQARSTSAPETDTQVESQTISTASNEAKSVVVPAVKETPVEQSVEEARTVTHTVEAVPSPQSEALVRYAWVTREVSQEEFKNGIPLSDTKTLKTSPIEAESVEQGGQVGCQVQIFDTSNNTIFEAVKTEANLWNIHTNQLEETEHKKLLELPQTTERYVSETNGQDLVEHLKINPDYKHLFDPATADDERVAFIGDSEEPDFQIEAIEVKKGPNKGKFIIEIIDKDEDTVFHAISAREPEQVAHICQNKIPADYLNEFLESVSEAQSERDPQRNQAQVGQQKERTTSSQAEM
ncbi:hypothetical protein ACQ4M3_20515 [Leptolyngbya sp. AN03gr2]|uniref:hypothetical protein n=1 Tax=unclassified Leptolyngbya TaxID=2650499 RepID=UPI003D31571D